MIIKQKIKRLSRKEEYALYLRTDYWKNLKKNIVAFRGPQCEKCGEWFDDLENELYLHHITYRGNHREKWEDLVLLCESCHKREHSKFNLMPIKDYNQFVDPCEI